MVGDTVLFLLLKAKQKTNSVYVAKVVLLFLLYILMYVLSFLILLKIQ